MALLNHSFNPFNHPIMFSMPEWLTRSPAWQEHIPFAMFLVSAHQPNLIVELGTLLGDSYCAFCQAVKALKLNTKCYAVDTWEGDAHTGLYGNSVLQELRNHHDPRYSSFSRLLQSYFDDALPHIEDNSIDILHIDGLHTYDAVKHDYESWLPKLSERGIILFHDTNVREKDFGVYKLWGELKSIYPHFEFMHGHGLGVLAVGKVISPDLITLFNCPPEDAAIIREFFFQLGQRLTIKSYSVEQELNLNKLSTQLDETARKLRVLEFKLKEIEREKDIALLTTNNLNAQLDGITNSSGWRLLQKAWRVRRWLLPNESRRYKTVKILGRFIWTIFNRIKKQSSDVSQDVSQTENHIVTSLSTSTKPPTIFDLSTSDYQSWLKRHSPSQTKADQQSNLSEQFSYRPLISVVTPAYNTIPQILQATIKSVIRQTYTNWELCITNVGETNNNILFNFVQQDSRIKVKMLDDNYGISDNTNEAIKMASGDFIALLDHDDELEPSALFEYVQYLNLEPNTDVLYSDEDKLDENGIRCEPFFKPGWSPEYFRGVMYIGHLLCFRRALLDHSSLLDRNYDGVQDFEFMLRISEKTSRIRHVPKILYHWRKSAGSIAQDVNAKPNIGNLQMAAVNAHLRRLNIHGKAEIATPHHQLFIIPQPSRRNEMVSIIIPTKDAANLLEKCLTSIFSLSTHINLEVLLIDNDTTEQDALKIMERFPIVKIGFPGLFNYSKANNLGASYARGDHLLFLNNDTEVITPDWIETLLLYSIQNDVGAVGGLLLYPDKSIQHAGIILGPRGTADHLMRGFDANSTGYAGSLICAREVTAVTAACMMIKRDLFEKIGGFNEHYFTHYQDIDLCLKLRDLGKRNIITPRAKLVHHESETRRDYYDYVDYSLLLDQWQEVIEQGDPYYNPNFDPHYCDYTVRVLS